MSILDRALRMGEGKKFRAFEERVARIGDFEPEVELRIDDELRRAPTRCTSARVTASRSTTSSRVVRAHSRGGPALARAAPLRRPADRRHGPARRLDRRDEDRRGQDAHRHACGRAQLAGRRRRAPRHRQRLPRPPRRRVDGPDLRGARRHGRGAPDMQPDEEKQAAYAADITYGTNSEFGFDYLRDNMAKTRDEQVHHGDRQARRQAPRPPRFAIVDEVDNILIDEARTPLIISGAPEQAADLYQRFARLAPLLDAGEKPEGLDPPARRSSWPTTTTSTTRSTRPSRSPSAAWPRPRNSWASTTCTAPRTATWSTT